VKTTIRTILLKAIPERLVDDLLDAFETIQRDVITRRLGGGDAGKFVETYVQILQILETGRFESPPSRLKGTFVPWNRDPARSMLDYAFARAASRAPSTLFEASETWCTKVRSI
jgi:hypothetical protein